MKVYILTETTLGGYSNSFKVVAVYACQTTAQREADRLTQEEADTFARAKEGGRDLQSSLTYEVIEKEVMEG